MFNRHVACSIIYIFNYGHWQSYLHCTVEETSCKVQPIRGVCIVLINGYKHGLEKRRRLSTCILRSVVNTFPIATSIYFFHHPFPMSAGLLNLKGNDGLSNVATHQIKVLQPREELLIDSMRCHQHYHRSTTMLGNHNAQIVATVYFHMLMI